MCTGRTRGKRWRGEWHNYILIKKNTEPEKASINQAKTVYGLQGWPALGAWRVNEPLLGQLSPQGCENKSHRVGSGQRESTACVSETS